MVKKSLRQKLLNQKIRILTKIILIINTDHLIFFVNLQHIRTSHTTIKTSI